MKKLINVILVFATMTITLFNSCSSKSAEKKKVRDLEKNSWKNEWTKSFQLVRPIEFEEDAVDAYGEHLINHKENWYIISKSSDCFLLPVKIRYGINPSLEEQLVEYSHKAVIDTMLLDYKVNTTVHVFSGLRRISKLEVLCLINPTSTFKPCAGSLGEMSVCVEK